MLPGMMMGCGVSTDINVESPPPEITDSYHPSLIAMYTMDNISGSTLVDGGVNGYDGTINGATAVVGRFGNALNFTGYPQELYLPFVAPATGITYSLWLNRASDQSLHTLVDDHPANGASVGSRLSVRYITATDELLIAGGNGAAACSGTFIGIGSVIGTYVHLVVTRNLTTFKCWVNGVELAINDSTGLPQALVTGTTTICIGGVHYNYTDRNLNGEIDQLRIFNRELTSGEVLTLYNEVSS